MEITEQIKRNEAVTAVEIEDLRGAVDWDRFENEYDKVLGALHIKVANRPSWPGGVPSHQEFSRSLHISARRGGGSGSP